MIIGGYCSLCNLLGIMIIRSRETYLPFFFPNDFSTSVHTWWMVAGILGIVMVKSDECSGFYQPVNQVFFWGDVESLRGVRPQG